MSERSARFDVQARELAILDGVAHRHRLTTHAAILDVRLRLDRQIQEQRDRLAAVRATQFSGSFEHGASVAGYGPPAAGAGASPSSETPDETKAYDDDV